MLLFLVSTSAWADPDGSAMSGLQRAALYGAAGGLVLDGIDRPAFSTANGHAVGAVGMGLSYVSLPTLAVSALQDRRDLVAGGASVSAAGGAAALGLIGASAVFDVATVAGSFSSTAPRRALSGLAAVCRGGALVASVAQIVANDAAGGGGLAAADRGWTLGVDASPDRAGLVLSGRF